MFERVKSLPEEEQAAAREQAENEMLAAVEKVVDQLDDLLPGVQESLDQLIQMFAGDEGEGQKDTGESSKPSCVENDLPEGTFILF